MSVPVPSVAKELASAATTEQQIAELVSSFATTTPYADAVAAAAGRTLFTVTSRETGTAYTLHLDHARPSPNGSISAHLEAVDGSTLSEAHYAVMMIRPGRTGLSQLLSRADDDTVFMTAFID